MTDTPRVSSCAATPAVFDNAPNEIGEGSGVEVGLIRALVKGDILIAIQRLGDCVSSAVYQTAVVCASLSDCG